MTKHNRVFAAFLVLALALLLTACGASSGDKVERFAEAAAASH